MNVLHFNTLKNVELRNRFSWLGFAIEFALGLHWFFINYIEKLCPYNCFDCRNCYYKNDLILVSVLFLESVIPRRCRRLKELTFN